MHSTSTSPSYPSTQSKMASKSTDYAASTFSESTTYSHEKPAAVMASKPKRSFRQKVKSVIKDIGTSPFEDGGEKHKQSAGWLSSMPPSKI